MASGKEYLDFILEQLSELEEATYYMDVNFVEIEAMEVYETKNRN